MKSHQCISDVRYKIRLRKQTDKPYFDTRNRNMQKNPPCMDLNQIYHKDKCHIFLWSHVTEEKKLKRLER